MRRIGNFVVAASWVVAASAGSARAADEDPIVAKATALESKVAEHTAAKSVDALKEDVKEAVALYQENAKKDPSRERIVKIIGGISRFHADDVAKAAMDGLGETGDPSGAKYIHPFLHPADDKGPVPATLEPAIETAKKLPDDSLVDPLIQIVDQSKKISIAAKAIDSLGAFGGLKRSREHILEALTKSVFKSKSGPRRSNSPDNQSNPDGGVGNSQNAGSGDRWKTLSEALPTALNQLTGNNRATADDWITAVQQAKGKLSGLFSDKPADAKPQPPAK